MNKLSLKDQEDISSVLNVLSSIYFFLGNKTPEFSGKYQDPGMKELSSVKTIDELPSAGGLFLIQLIQKWVQKLAPRELEFDTVRDIVRGNIQALQTNMEKSLATFCLNPTPDNARAFEGVFYNELYS